MKPITIVGGGLAGLTLGIGLRRQGVPVTVWEAGHYPRHRVCGEFISGHGQDALERLRLRDCLIHAGAIPARTATFFLGNAQSPVRPLPAAALCLSRFKMDAALARKYCEHGGELREGQRWRDQRAGEGVVWANGRRLKTRERGWRWFGLKVHARNVASVADLEMHGSANGYVGITRVDDGKFNVCGLFRRSDSDRDGVQAWTELLRGATGTPLRARMAGATLDEHSFCSVAGLSLRPQRARDHAESSIGDALTMIPPVTGNGMSMAFEAAEMAIPPMAAYSRGEISWSRAKTILAGACDTVFARRLVWAGWLQWMMFAFAARSGLGRVVLNSEMVWQVMFTKTR